MFLDNREHIWKVKVLFHLHDKNSITDKNVSIHKNIDSYKTKPKEMNENFPNCHAHCEFAPQIAI